MVRMITDFTFHEQRAGETNKFSRTLCDSLRISIFHMIKLEALQRCGAEIIYSLTRQEGAMMVALAKLGTRGPR
jgi:hypothetical protein